MKIAVASSGLGHVARGIETWALDTSVALAERGEDVTLFAAGKVEGLESNGRRFKATALPCLRRGGSGAKRLALLFPGFAWRWGLKAEYGWEQFSFWLHLWSRLRSGGFDVLHVQDPMLAYWCRRFRILGLVGTKEILAHGTEEPVKFLAQFDYVQHLAPWHLVEALKAFRGNRKKSSISTARQQDNGTVGQQDHGSTELESSLRPFWTAIPNFVDISVFTPESVSANKQTDEESPSSRERLGIPVNAFVIGTAATVKRPHKRIDYLIREFALLLRQAGYSRLKPGRDSGSFRTQRSMRSNELPDQSVPECRLRRPYLVIAGARTSQSGDLIGLAEELAPGRVSILLDLPRESMPCLYRSLDIFVLVSLFEMMPIAVLEALASGLPVVANRHPVLEWMIDAEGASGVKSGGSCGGACIDMSHQGALSGFLGQVTRRQTKEYGKCARKRAEEMFAKEVVITQCTDYYRRVVRGRGQKEERMEGRGYRRGNGGE